MVGRFALESRLRSVHRVNEPSSEHGGSSLMSRGSASLVSTPGSGGDQNSRRWCQSKNLQPPPNAVTKAAENQALQKKSLKKSVYLVLSPSTAPTTHGGPSPLLRDVLFPATPPGPGRKFPCLNTPVPVSHSPGVSLQKPAHILLLTTKRLLCI